jgi:hypothetical protein
MSSHRGQSLAVKVKFAGLRRFASPSLWGEFGDSIHAYMRSHIFVHRATTKYFSNSFVFKNEIEKEGLPRDITLPWAQVVPRSNLGAPTKTSRVFSLTY